MKALIRPLFRHYLAKKFILKNLPQGSLIFDIGCGRGDFDFWLAEKGYKMECFEFSGEAVLEFLKIKEVVKSPNITLHTGNFMLENTTSDADAIIFFEVLEHLENEKDALIKINSWLKPGGYLIISVPAHMSKWGHDDEIFGHKRRYEKKHLCTLLTASKFEVIQFYSYGFPWLNILKLIREIMVKINPPKFYHPDSNKHTETGTKHSGVGFFKKNFWFILFNPLTFYPLILISNLFNKFDFSEGYFMVVKKVS